MTTIVYHKESDTIAYDSQSTAGDFISGHDVNKCLTCGGIVFFLAGAHCDFESFMRIHTGEAIDPIHGNASPDCCAIGVDNGDVYIYGMDKDVPFKALVTGNKAIGSGYRHAITALDLGTSPKKAVEMAILRDTYSGGTVMEYKIVATDETGRVTYEVEEL